MATRTAIAFAVLCILSSIIIVSVVIGVFVFYKMRLNETQAVMAAVANDNIMCPCVNGGMCKLVVDLTITAPAFVADAYNRDIAAYVANLIACVELPWAEKHKNKSNVVVPTGITLKRNIMYKNNVIGVICVDEKNNCHYVVFRGTTTQEEWKKDMDYALTPITFTDATRKTAMMMMRSFNNNTKTAACGCSGYKYASDSSGIFVHNGFLTVYEAIRQQLMLGLTEATKIVIGGHSLGGALASLLLTDSVLLRNNKDAVAYTFGQPRVGNAAYARIQSQGNLFRIANTSDVITQLPLSSTPNFASWKKPYQYMHGGQVKYLYDPTTSPATEINFGSLLANHAMPIYMKFLP